jgi:hypothetical protein
MLDDQFIYCVGRTTPSFATGCQGFVSGLPETMDIVAWKINVNDGSVQCTIQQVTVFPDNIDTSCLYNNTIYFATYTAEFQNSTFFALDPQTMTFSKIGTHPKVVQISKIFSFTFFLIILLFIYRGNKT